MSVMVLQGLKYSPQKSRPLESGHRRHGVCIAIECSYKLDQKNEFKFLCELCTFSQIRSHIATHANLILLLKPALYFSTLVIKLRKKYKIVLCRNSYCNTIGQYSFIIKLRNPHGTPTYKTKALRLVSNVQLVKRLLPCNGRQIQHYLALLWK